ncbi:uncharacterized protein KQ657_003255 [Scheffersomyces spartinae]|uniref:phosphoserine phosphatase n=1 Tax=Scheffersomyces spartinae TaxID=45513 RepID=A0A9P7VD24_9ASCO|nr:uncharacterized protein KQ657_003255 [Scheffersomyces spartinae]KAG7195492.1 hypothetical protein KQ657_003255 [Scheffersomyces spartinae]
MSYVITLISHLETVAAPEHVSKAKDFITAQLGLTIELEKALSPRAIDFIVGEPANLESTKSSIKSHLLSGDAVPPYDLIFQKNDDARKNKKLFIFDMDSTLIYQEVIELIAAYADIEDKVAEITTRAMNGELDFNQSLAERVNLLKGIDSTSIWEELKHKIQITNGAIKLAAFLKSKGAVLGVLSGGFIPLAEHIKGQLGLDYAYANTLGTNETNILNGTTVGPIVNAERKAHLLLEIASKHGIDPVDAVAVGDGANDLKMMEVAGFGVAWNAKPKVQQVAPCCLNTKSLADILYILGYSDDEI